MKLMHFNYFFNFSQMLVNISDHTSVLNRKEFKVVILLVRFTRREKSVLNLLFRLLIQFPTCSNVNSAKACRLKCMTATNLLFGSLGFSECLREDKDNDARFICLPLEREPVFFVNWVKIQGILGHLRHQRETAS